MIWQFAIYGFLSMLFGFIGGLILIAYKTNQDDPDNEEWD
ncbi:hypothetical protein AGR5A_Cc10019 [Agrobacterium genomosp. 5 str. CFBP 6626]|nr:hypothetical protein AGR5A_Cc10019 [Agrobacterium genomosp. 5 str. CFBP 6626]